MKLVPAGATRSLARQVLKAKKNSPHIFFAAGVVGSITSTVLACRATIKLPDALDEVQKNIANTKKSIEVAQAHPQYNHPEYIRDITAVYARNALVVAKLYAPSVAVGVVSIGCLTGSHIQLSKRNAALSTTLAAVTKAYSDYRQRVEAELGGERQTEIQNATDNQVMEVEGKKKVVKVTDTSGLSPSHAFFDEYSSSFSKDPESNRTFLMLQQNVWNLKLKSRGHVFLNEVLESLGLPHTSYGAIMGWTWDGREHEKKDGWIDFGMYEARCHDFWDENEPRILLNFNVDDEPIFEQI